MQPSRFRRSARALAVLTVVLALLAAACGSDDNKDKTSSATTTKDAGGAKVKVTGVPGVTDTEIKFSAYGTNSNNPLGTCVLTCYTDGIKAYFAWRNSEGGLDGRKLVLSKELDDELGKNQQRALELISANDTFASFAAGQLAAGWAEMAKIGWPLYVWNIWPTEAAKPSIYGEVGVICITCLNRSVAYVVKLTGAKKIASLGYGVSDNSKQAALTGAKTIETYSKDIGNPKVVYVNENLAFGLTNGVGPEVSAMKKAGVDLVLNSIDLNGAKTVAQEMARQGMGDVPMLHANTYDQDFVKANASLFEGDYVGVAFRPFEANSAGSNLATYKKWMGETGAKITEIGMRGWINADEAYQGIKLAGPSFDRAKVIEASNTKMDRYTAGGLVPPLDFSRQHEAPTPADPVTHGNKPDCFGLVKIHNGAFTVVGDKEKPFLCWPADNRQTWSDPTPTNFK